MAAAGLEPLPGQLNLADEGHVTSWYHNQWYRLKVHRVKKKNVFLYLLHIEYKKVRGQN